MKQLATKAVRLDDLPEEAWVYVLGGPGSAGDTELEEAWSAVAWLWRCVDIRANKVAACKWAVTRKGSEKPFYESDQGDPAPNQWEWLAKLPTLLAKAEAASCLVGAGYWAKDSVTGLRIKGASWMHPGTVRPKYKDSGQVDHFERHLPTEQKPRSLKPELVVAFWPPDWTVETGPAENTPGKAALKAAGVLANMDTFLESYFERGAIKVTLLTYTGVLGKGRQEELKTWWQKVASGVKNAFTSHVINADKVQPVIIGEGLKDLENSTLSAEKREEICAAMGVPLTKVLPNAANYATKQGDDESFVTDTIVPELRWMEAVLNDQLFDPMGYRFQFLPEEYPEMQADENDRAQSFAMYVQAGMPLLLAADMLGIYIPPEYKRQLKEAEELAMEQRRKLAEMSPTGKPEDAGLQEDDDPADKAWQLKRRLDEADRLERWLRKDPARDPADYATDLLSGAEKAAIASAVRRVDDTGHWRPNEPTVVVVNLERPTPDELSDPTDIARLLNDVERWARQEGVNLDKILDARPADD